MVVTRLVLKPPITRLQSITNHTSPVSAVTLHPTPPSITALPHVRPSPLLGRRLISLPPAAFRSLDRGSQTSKPPSDSPSLILVVTHTHHHIATRSRTAVFVLDYTAALYWAILGHISAVLALHSNCAVRLVGAIHYSSQLPITTGPYAYPSISASYQDCDESRDGRKAAGSYRDMRVTPPFVGFSATA